ncbi:MAG: hypothetical protein RLZZ390_1142, partial [Bacteroidota bacterium]
MNAKLISIIHIILFIFIILII